ncbi:substrate-binding domain-containing protein [Nonomuraea sp. NPDC046802]|uniref:substrate-binding domain-containing protein n=1 Tax=Nonomuraea sp. NPDC046802 TaxID=3154919 RepID=UPI0033FB0B8E
MTRLAKKGLVAEDWNAGPTKGMVTDSVVVIATRKGNPKNLKIWDDLTKPGVEVITPNRSPPAAPAGGVLAGYGAKSGKGADKQTGVDFLHALFANLPVQGGAAGAAYARRRPQ